MLVFKYCFKYCCEYVFCSLMDYSEMWHVRQNLGQDFDKKLGFESLS